MTYDEKSGLYYDYKSGYYFDAARSLYYDCHSGTYYSYNYESSSYEVHSQVPLNNEGETAKKKGREKRQKKANPDENVSGRKRFCSGPTSDECQQDLKEGKDEEADTQPVESAPEDGEISSSDSSESDSELSGQDVTSSGLVTSSQPTPCIRIVITETSDMTVGTLFIVTCTGGSIGRQGDHEVLLLDEPACSKSHARITHNDGHYYLTDMGSANGTFVNGRKLSESQAESTPLEIGHGTLIQIGSTKLMCHVHPGRETCFECEPGQVQVPVTNAKAQQVTTSKEKSRKKALREIKKKYGLAGSGFSSQTSGSSQYEDRAGERRRQVGSDNPFEKTDASHVDKSIGAKNKGFKMLKKMGWSEGQGLGKESTGRTEPVPVQLKNDRSGLGDTLPAVPIDFKTKQKAELWRRTQDRFSKIKDTKLDIFTEENEDDGENVDSKQS